LIAACGATTQLFNEKTLNVRDLDTGAELPPSPEIRLPITARLPEPDGLLEGTIWAGRTGLNLLSMMECIRIEATNPSARVGEHARSSQEATRTDPITDLAPIQYRIHIGATGRINPFAWEGCRPELSERKAAGFTP
jgi:hypothetical protein